MTFTREVKTQQVQLENMTLQELLRLNPTLKDLRDVSRVLNNGRAYMMSNRLSGDVHAVDVVRNLLQRKG